MKIDLKVIGIDQLRERLAQFSDRRFGATLATALTRTAVDVREGVRQQLPSVFDRPTPYTLNSMFVRPATAARLEAETWFKDDRATSQMGTPATKYLMPNVEGGQRRAKRFERSLQAAGHLPPGWITVAGAGARLDAFGNVSKGQIIQILSQLRITLTAGHTRNMSLDARKKIGAQRRAGGRFFVIKPGTRGATPGVYQREFTGRNITPVLIFVRSATYRQRFDFDGISRKIAAERLPVHVERAIAEQMARLASAG